MNATDARERISAARASQKVLTQNLIVSSMLPDDPALPYARTVLRQMEQNDAMARMRDALAEFDGAQEETE